MASDEPEVTTVTSKGQITIPSQLRDEFGLEQGTKLMVVPTEYGLMLKKVELPSVEEFQQRVEERSDTTSLSLDDVSDLVHEARGEME
jgi:AbrB family looped-hinge helix DNA binding protein